ncbi:MAG: extracellular solute-binding protein [Verrucomicrobia bacterium]|nr:extracellular solute-binding protein [Verrucomicrobiota bacterium]
MEPSENTPESRRPGMIGLALLVAVAVGFGLGQWFHPTGPEQERLPAPSPSSIFMPQPKLIVYQEGPEIPHIWLDTFASAPGYLKVERRTLVRNSDGTWPTDGDVYLLKARSFPALGEEFAWADLTGKVSLDGINPVFQGQAFDPAGMRSRPWRSSPWFFMRKVASGTPAKTAMAPPARWMTETGAIFPNDPDLLGALWIKSQSRSVNFGGESARVAAKQQVEAVLAGKMATEEECWSGLKDGQVNFSYLPSWRLVMDPQAGGGLIRWAVLPAGTLVDFEVMAIREESPRKEMAFRFLEFLLAPSQQAALLGATGFFPVLSKSGQEWAGSTLAMPSGTWFDRSEFILWPYPQPVVPVAPAVTTETNVPVQSSSAEPKPE